MTFRGSENTAYVSATGGTVTTSGNFKIHRFNSSATFAVNDGGNSAGSNTVEYLVVAGGGGGGGQIGWRWRRWRLSYWKPVSICTKL